MTSYLHRHPHTYPPAEHALTDVSDIVRQRGAIYSPKLAQSTIVLGRQQTAVPARPSVEVCFLSATAQPVIGPNGDEVRSGPVRRCIGPPSQNEEITGEKLIPVGEARRWRAGDPR